MSDLLKEVITDRKAKAIDYENYLMRIYKLANKENLSQAPKELNSQGLIAIYNNLGKDLELALEVHETIFQKSEIKFSQV